MPVPDCPFRGLTRAGRLELFRNPEKWPRMCKDVLNYILRAREAYGERAFQRELEELYEAAAARGCLGVFEHLYECVEEDMEYERANRSAW